jgi:uncharacterized protein YyaL (SSP411 family)
MPNRLAAEASPYLRQHADNPVDWLPWGAEAFERARREDRPVHVSIGYFSCHWCHVMAHESFEDPRTAALLNDNFVNVKVDRQERPDIDELYQRVLPMMGESGGWPLTVFLTPEQQPFFAGTYFPPEERYGRPAFPRLLLGLARAWRERRHEVRANCEQFVQGWRELDEQLLAPARPAPGDLPLEAALAFARGTDPVNGGLGRAPKFPNVSCLDLMLRVWARFDPAPPDEPMRAALSLTLDAMAAGGLRDQLGGGFARYSVDERWAVPHFEKMLYDNAQLAKLYAEAARFTGNAAWLGVAQETCDYALRELALPGGAFGASEDADSEGEEGRYYVWTREQLVAALGEDDAALAAAAYGCTPAGNFGQGRNVLQAPAGLDAARLARLPDIHARLLQARAQRPRPARDDNVLSGWNGLMIQALCATYQAGGDPRYLAAARRAADFVQAHLERDGALMRAWREGALKGPAFLDDVAYLAHAHFDLYESALEARDLERALALVDRLLGDFWDDGLYFAARGVALPHRPLAPHDGACPSGLSSATLALLRAHAFTAQARYAERARDLLARFEGACARNFFGFAHLLAAREFDRRGAVTIALAGGAAAVGQLLAAVHRGYQPARALGAASRLQAAAGLPAGAQGEAGAAFVCRGGVCLPPVRSADDLRLLLAPAVP